MRSILVPLLLLTMARPSNAFQSSGTAATNRNGPAANKLGILVELFTSEGCSSCPPADELLRKLDSQSAHWKQRLVVLGEHVDYWDQTGWRDRFSSHEYTDRQEAYARRFHISGPYTPQIVVDGKHEFVGNDSRLLQAALREASSQPKTDVSLYVEARSRTEVLVRVEAGSLPGKNQHADLYVAVAYNSDETQVGGGENAGKHLRHVAVLRSLQHVAKIGPDGGQKELKMRLPKSETSQNVRLIAFLQEANYGPVLGATVEMLDQSPSTQ